MDAWTFAGWGEASRISDLDSSPKDIKELGVPHSSSRSLGEWSASAICGNDITSSCLYVSALAIMAAGAYAPISLLVVALVLYFYRKIYSEVGSALPLNGGTYTVLLNTTNKKLAAGAACLTLLSYIATAVISAGEAMHYLHQLWHSLDVTVATVTLLGVFALLNLLGISESAKVALGIFIIHMATLTVLSLFSVFALLKDPSILTINFSNPIPDGRSVVSALFFGFAAAMLGISGFESSANFIEEQKPGVFSKTLRNMWLAVAIFNPLICFLALGLLTKDQVAENATSLLAKMGELSAGQWLKTVVSIDAVLVLSGAVLTSYVGVIGLVRRMSLDRCLPPVFLRENKLRNTNHWIIIAFFLLCCGILLITHGEVSLLGGVYTISFLCVMALFAIGNMLLKHERSKLPRVERASWPVVVFGLIAVLVGLTGHLTAENLSVFGVFFAGMSAIVAVMLLRVSILRVCLYVLQTIASKILGFSRWVTDSLNHQIERISSQSIIYFSKGDSDVNLNQAALYVLGNEQTKNLRVVHCYEDESEIPPLLANHLKMIDHLYPQLKIDFIAVKGTFGPELIEGLSRRLKVPKNYMFIGTPGDRFPHDLAELGGVRLIIG